MTFQEIQELIKLVNKSNLAEFKMEQGDFKLSIRTSLYAESKVSQVVAASPVLPVAAAPVTSLTAGVPPAVSLSAATPAKEEKEKPSELPVAKHDSAKYLEIKSPMVGTFYRSASPEKPPYVEVGQKIKKGDIVCIIEAMKLFNEIESEVAGTIVKVLVDNAKPVEYEQVLFLVEPD
jgi:acetyl-CoA carboxylase biotin carboxyl carrier protein